MLKIVFENQVIKIDNHYAKNKDISFEIYFLKLYYARITGILKKITINFIKTVTNQKKQSHYKKPTIIN